MFAWTARDASSRDLDNRGGGESTKLNDARHLDHARRACDCSAAARAPRTWDAGSSGIRETEIAAVNSDREHIARICWQSSV